MNGNPAVIYFKILIIKINYVVTSNILRVFKYLCDIIDRPHSASTSSNFLTHHSNCAAISNSNNTVDFINKLYPARGCLETRIIRYILHRKVRTLLTIDMNSLILRPNVCLMPDSTCALFSERLPICPDYTQIDHMPSVVPSNCATGSYILKSINCPFPLHIP